MPIRMVEDDPQGNKKTRKSRRSVKSSSGGDSGGLGGALGGLVSTFRPALMKKSKLLIGLIVVAVIAYILFFRNSDMSLSGSNIINFDPPAAKGKHVAFVIGVNK
ncbi:MAG: hypothetical protein P8M19_06945 [Crocinitomicaceae bacterium]|nr:hypothetical protein [Crocinitomicaceae bacterium]MDG2441387.1 hypothetical protein [Crocinitomicaceae bacterium]